MEEQPGERMSSPSERPPEIARPFYDYILGRQPQGQEIGPSHYLIVADVLEVNQRIERFIQENPDTQAQVIMMAAGQMVPEALLIGCDPNSDLFVISGYPE